MDSEEEMQHTRHTQLEKLDCQKNYLNAVSLGLGCIVLSAAGSAGALSLGGLNVLSAPGQPIRGEIEVLEDKPGEAEGVGLSIATPDQYRAMGLNFNPIINTLIFDAYRRVDNRVFLKITSPQSVNLPYFDLLLVAATPTGELRRQYTFYIGEAANAKTASAAPVVSPAVLPTPAVTAKPIQSPAPVSNTVPNPVADRGLQFSSNDPQPALKTTNQSAAATGNAVSVKKGSSLSNIARDNAYAGVSLEQMMASLYYSNPNAFINKNINLIKAGSTLKIPSQAEVSSVSAAKAKGLIRAHSRNFNQYRRTLSTQGPGSAGKFDANSKPSAVKAEVVDGGKKSVTGDKVELSKGTAVQPAVNGTGNVKATEEQKIAQSLEQKDRAEKEAAAKKALDDLNAVKRDLDANGKVVSGVQPGANAIPSIDATTAAKPVEVAQGTPVSWLDKVLQIWSKFKWWIIGGLAALLALLMLSRRSKPAEDDYYPNVAKQPTLNEEDELGHEPQDSDYAEDGAEVSANPLHEAGVYMNYGRYQEAQRVLELAEENGYPDELGIKLMLAEIHSKALDYKEFEKVSDELRILTGGVGHQWAKVEELARAFDSSSAPHEFVGGNAVLDLFDGAGGGASSHELAGRDSAQSSTGSKQAKASADEDGFARGVSGDAGVLASSKSSMSRLADEMQSAIAPEAEKVKRAHETQAEIQAQAREHTQDVVQQFNAQANQKQTKNHIEPAFTEEEYSREFDLSGLSLDLGDHSEAGLRVDMNQKSTPSAVASNTSLAFDKLMRAEALKSQGDIGGAKHLVEELLKLDLGNLTDSVKRLQRSLDA